MKNNFIYILIYIFSFLFITGCGDSKTSISKLEDVKNVSVGAMTGTTGENLAITKFPEAQTKSFDDIMDAIAALKSNQIEAVITAYPTALNVTKHNQDLTILPEAVDFENTCIALRKGNEDLLSTLNNIITELENDGSLADMKRRWLKKDLLPYEEVDIKLPEKGKLLKIGTSATREPFCFVDANQKVTGHDGEFARRVAAKLNRPMQFVDMKFSALIPALQSGKVDIIIAGMSSTPERAKSVDFSKTYFQNSQVLIVKKSEDAKVEEKVESPSLQSHNDLKDKKIGVLLGSVHDTYALKNYPNATILQYKSPPELVLGVKSGKIDAAIYTTETLLEILRTDNELQAIGDTLFTIPIGMGFNKKDTLLREQFNQFLKKIKEEGTFDDMKNRWIIKGETVMPAIKNSKKNGTLIVGTVSDKGLPFTIVKDNRMIGFDIEISERFAAYLGKELKLVDMEFGSLIISAVTNKIEMISSTLMITDERKKQIDFSDEYMRLGATVFALKKNVIQSDPKIITSLEDINGKTVGVYGGTVHDAFVEQNFPGTEIKRFSASADIILSLKSEKIDVAFLDLVSAKVLLKSNPEIKILTDDVLDLPVGIGFNKKNPELRNRFNAFLKEIKADGTFEQIYKRWFIDDPEEAIMPKFKFDENAPLIRLATSVGDLPNSAIVNGEHVGFDIEMLKTFAQRSRLNLKIITMEFPSLIAALSSGKVDMIADGIAITDERKKQIDFSDGYNMFKTAVLVLDKNLDKENSINKNSSDGVSFFANSFLFSLKESFYNNIILENRYLLILDGLQTTIIISILATLFGTLLGGLICFMRMSKKKMLLVPAKIYISILRGTPVLVILMIIFYVVFASVDIEPVIVAVIAFGLNFAAYVSEMYRTGIEGVDKGQTEAGIAMGFTKVKTFVYIILPQAIKRILPVYKGEVISLVKMTSIVGYIAVQDLTKASDIIRSRTFDAFFPLIMVAVLYFIISWLLMVSLGYVERLTGPNYKAKRGV
jgi:polar amino acid transport system substrate-binding protein